MKTETTIEGLRRSLFGKQNVGLVPTMGALHRGHLSLVEGAREHCDTVVVSIFVNPLQFNAPADLETYPRSVEADLEALKAAGADIVFVPEVSEIFPWFGKDGMQATTLRAGSMSQGLCGAKRPGHFDGVVTVVAALFNLVQPSVAIFGEKDFQQLKVIEQMVRELHFPVRIEAAPLVREPDGLAMSSRNQRLNKIARRDALLIYEALCVAEDSVSEVRDARELVKRVTAYLSQSPNIQLDYVEIVDVHTLQPLATIDSEAQLLVAAFVGDVRLIDNVRLSVSR